MNVKTVDVNDLPYRPCVGIALFNADGKVWAGRRLANTETYGEDALHWQMPQGGIDKGEDPYEAAKRELWEETGVTTATLLGEADGWLNYDLPDAIMGVALKGKYRGQTQRWFAFRFEGDESEINITEPPNGSHQEFDKWEWKNLGDMPDHIVVWKREVYQKVVEAFDEFSG